MSILLLEISQLDKPLQSLLVSKASNRQHSETLNQRSLRIWFKEYKSQLLERHSPILKWITFDPILTPAIISGRVKYQNKTGIISPLFDRVRLSTA